MSTALLIVGVGFVFAGFSAALGFTTLGVLASVTAIVTLLYAGGVWFGAPAPAPRRDSVILFDHHLRIACGAAAGTPVRAQFPPSLRREIDVRCAAVLRGEAGRVAWEEGGAALEVHLLPVRAADGTILFGIAVDAHAARESVLAGAAAG